MLEVGVIMYKSCEECECKPNGVLRCQATGNCTCIYGPWSDWGQCSVTCGSGWKRRTREVDSNYGVSCDETHEENHCKQPKCEVTTTPVVCPPWGEWSPCDCELMPHTRKRSRITASTNPDCKPNVEIEGCKDLCNMTTTPVCTYDEKCVEPCHETCLGFRKPSICASNECDIECPCPDGQRYLNGVCINETDCPCYDDDGNAVDVWGDVDPPDDDPCTFCQCYPDNHIKCMPRDFCCSWGTWNQWSDCSHTCNEGVRYRDRSYTGDECTIVDGHQAEPCYNAPCEKDCVVNGTAYDNGDVISNCTCEVCYCTRTGVHCVDNVYENVDGQYSPWSNWSSCTRSCDGGLRTRTRLCDNPPPRCAGASCEGPPIEVDDCNVDVPCCETNPWSDWGPCSTTCGTGVRTRGRSYLDPADALSCNHTLTEEQPCFNNIPCDSTCDVSPWTVWSPCSRSCGAGLIRRQRTVLSGDCTDVNLIDETFCYESECTCDPPFVWSNHSLCEVTCEQMAEQDNCGEQFDPDCICPAGTYFKDGQCVTLQECYHCVIDGTTYLPGDVWYPEGACEVCQCVDGHEVCESIMEMPTCGPDEQITYVEGPCCPKCEPVKDTCSLKTRVSKLYKDDCETETDVTYQVCSGTCGVSTSTPHLFTQDEESGLLSLKDDDCKCCTGVQGGNQTVTLICRSGDTIPAFVPIFTGCLCNSCVEPSL